MNIAQIKTLAWKLYEAGDETLAFEFKGKKIIYPWLDFNKGAFELSTIEAINEYGLNNIRDFCSRLASRCTGQIQSPTEWAGEPDLDENLMRAYDKWLEKDVKYIQGKIVGLEA